MCAPSPVPDVHYEFRYIPCLEGQKFASVNEAFRAACKSLGAVVDSEAKIVRVKTTVIRKTHKAEAI